MRGRAGLLGGELAVAMREAPHIQGRLAKGRTTKYFTNTRIPMKTPNLSRTPGDALAKIAENHRPAWNDLIANGSSRREFMRISGLSLGATGLSLSKTGLASEQPASAREPGAVLTQLLEGNKRFAKGELTHPRRQIGRAHV